MPITSRAYAEMKITREEAAERIVAVSWGGGNTAK
jgi:hypothetical protein